MFDQNQIQEFKEVQIPETVLGINCNNQRLIYVEVSLIPYKAMLSIFYFTF